MMLCMNSKHTITFLHTEKLNTLALTVAVSPKLKKLGWHSHVEPAQPTLGKGNSGGVAILHRPWITVLGKMEVIHPARCIALPIYTRGTGQIFLYTFYGYNQIQQRHLPQETVNMLDLVADHAKAHGKPYVIVGDFNATPHDVHVWSRQHMTPARLVHCLGATCRPSVGAHRTLDFYIMSPVLADIVEDPVVDIQTHFRFHSPVGMNFKRINEIPWTRVLSPVVSGSPVVVFGPHQLHPHIWDDLYDALLA